MIEANRAELLLSLGQFDDAVASCDNAFAIAVDRGDKLNAAEALKRRGEVERHRGRCSNARITLTAAKALADECEDALLGAEILRELAHVCEMDGKRDDAREAWSAAHEKFITLGAAPDATSAIRYLRLMR